MKILTIEKDEKGKTRADFKGSCDWNILRKSPVEGDDLRFTLYDGDDDHLAFMFDIDHYAFYKRQKVINAAREVLDVKHYVVGTGRGFHVYVPVSAPFPGSEFAHYKKSYLKLVERFIEALGEEKEFDTNVFSAKKLGRVPGSRNSKGGMVVLYAEHHGPLCRTLGDVLERHELKDRHQIPIKTVGENGPQDSPIMKYCGAMRWVRDQKTCRHDLWKALVYVCKAAGDRDLAHYISQGDDYDGAEVDRLLDGEKEKLLTCQIIDGEMNKLGYTACPECKFYPLRMSPIAITGPHPTPSYTKGFFKTKKVKTIDSTKTGPKGGVVYKEEYVPDTRSVEVDDLYAYYVNRKFNDVVYVEEKDTLYEYVDSKWQLLTHCSKVSSSVLNEVAAGLATKWIPRGTEAAQIGPMFKNKQGFRAVPLEKFDRAGYIKFRDGALELETGEFLRDTKRMYFTAEVNTNYEANAKCPTFTQMLERHIPNKLEQRLYQVFLGLSISQIPNYAYESFLWMKGSPGAGKTTFLEVFKILSNGSHIAVKGEENFAVSNATKVDFTGKSVMWMDDFKLADKRQAPNWESFINKIASGEEIYIDPKYVQAFEAKPTCTLVATSNQDPPFTGSDQGLMRRLRYLSLNMVVDKKDSDIRQKLERELPGIANWALEGLNFFREHGMPEESENEKIAKLDMQQDIQDVMGEFVKGHIVWEEGAKDRLDSIYNNFCKIHSFTEASYPRELFNKRSRDKICAHFRCEVSDIRGKWQGKLVLKNVIFKEKVHGE